MATESRIETEADSLGERGLGNGESSCQGPCDARTGLTDVKDEAVV